jgi:catechol 2,3-dioxygenase-like lactoylglutathione lyase family enzyme
MRVKSDRQILQKIGYVVVFVRNWDKAMQFYADLLGLDVVTRQDRGGFAEFSFPAGGPNLLIEQVDKTDIDAHALVGQFVGMSVTVRDIRRAYDHLSARGIRFEAAPARQVWGGMLAHFYDPDGNMWSLVEELSGSKDTGRSMA